MRPTLRFSEGSSDRTATLAGLVSCAASIAILFSWALDSDRQFAFRDVAHYYRPLWMHTQAQWHAGHLPLLSPEERGRPLLADPTTAAFYPGKLLFALPLDFDTSFKLFLIGHVAFCFVSTWISARRFGLHATSSYFASITYTLGGSIVFQTCNPPYLIGASWLPLGISAGYQLVTRARVRNLVELAFVLAMMVLGGDPQSAFLLGLGLMLLVIVSSQNLRGLSVSKQIRASLVATRHLFVAGVLGASLCALQWLPTSEWAAESERRLMAAAPPSAFDTETEDPRYRFSIGPWRWAELFWPNLSGRPFPIHSRWVDAIPAEGRFWSPTLYMGFLTPWLAFAALRLRGGRLGQRWLTWLLLVSLLGSLGRFGFGWLLNEVNGAEPGPLRDEVGGLYWLLVRSIPGFGIFRYSAKLWTWVALSISLLASIRLDDAIRQQRPALSSRFLKRWGVVSCALVVALLAFISSSAFNQFAPNADALYGPFQKGHAITILAGSLIHGSLVALLTLLILNRFHSRAAINCAALLVSLTAFELSVGHRWLQPSAILAPEPAIPRVAPNTIVHRQQLQGWYPNRWQTTSSPDRIQACFDWDQRSLRAKHPLIGNVGSLCGYTSFSTPPQRGLQELLEELGKAEPTIKFEDLLGQLGVEFYSRKKATLLADGEATFGSYTTSADSDGDSEITRIASPNPLCWLPRTIQIIAPHKTADAVWDDVETWMMTLRPMLLKHDGPIDLQARSLVITDDAPPVVQPEAEALIARQISPHHLVIDINIDSGGWLVINRAPINGWTATTTIGPRNLDIETANGIMMGLKLPAGRQTVTLRYRPRTLNLGFFISIASVGVVIILIAHDRKQTLELDRAVG